MFETAGKKKFAAMLAPVGLVFGLTSGAALAAGENEFATSAGDGMGVTVSGECLRAIGGTAPGNCVEAEADSDGDGVPDSRDKCPGTPRGVEVDADGCPLDSDGDGVPDYRDKCPGTPRGAKVDSDGCEITADVTIRTTTDHFDFDSAELKPKMMSELDAVAGKVRASKGREMLEVIGHTDSTGPEAYNQGLSERRAQAAADYLVDQGVSPSMITVKGMGESAPVADNSTREGRAMNRRVEILTR